MSEHTISDFEETMNVEFLPHTDAYMRGLRSATVTKVGRKYVHVMIFSLNAASIYDMKVLPQDLKILS